MNKNVSSRDNELKNISRLQTNDKTCDMKACRTELYLARSLFF